MECRLGFFVLGEFVLFELFAFLLLVFGAPIIVWLPVALAIPVVMIAAAIKVTFEMIRNRRKS